MADPHEPPRERWINRSAFLSAAIGSAVGIGNVWRFPYLAYEGGGGAFFIPYLLSIVFIGWPLLTLELALGQVYQTGDVNCFGKMHRRMRGVGIASIWTSFSIASYYCVILGYCCIMLINVGREPWLGNEAGKGTLAEIGDQGFVQKCMLDEGQIVLDSAAAEQYFLIEVVGLEFGRGLQCLSQSGEDYKRSRTPNWGMNCEGEPVVRLQDGTYAKEYGSWNAPCYKKNEKGDSICTSDAECEGLRTCSPFPDDFDLTKVPSDLEGSRLVGQCAGPDRDGPQGSCNPCQRHGDEKDCWADKDTPGLDCYWVREKCQTGGFREVAPLKNGGYHDCLDEGYVFEWGGAYTCGAVKALGLCGEEDARKRCPETCDACIFVKYEEACDEGAWGFHGKLFGATVIVWFFVILCLVFGIKVTGIITYFTMAVPFGLIIALFFAGITLDGAEEGVRQYIGRWEFEVLTQDPIIWANAAGQTFFTLGIGFGIMTAYSSYNGRETTNTVVNAIIIAFVDTLVAFIAGFSVFCIVGNFAYKRGVPFEEVGSLSGFFLAFVTYPVALSKLSGGAVWCGVFFFTLLMLGIDSAFSIAEAVITSLHDSRRFHHLPRSLFVVGVAVVALIFGLFYCLDTGLYTLDAVDFYVANISLIFVGLMECIACGWVYGHQRQAEKIGAAALAIHNFAWFVVLICGPTSAFWIGGKDGCVMGLTFSIFVIITGACLGHYWIDRRLMPHLSEGERAFELWLGNIEELREEMNAVIVPMDSKNMKIPMFWAILIKYFIPPALSCIFAITFASSFGFYLNYSSRYQAAGIVISFMTVIFVVAGILFPGVFDWLAPPEGHLAETDDDRIAHARGGLEYVLLPSSLPAALHPHSPSLPPYIPPPRLPLPSSAFRTTPPLRPRPQPSRKRCSPSLLGCH